MRGIDPQTIEASQYKKTLHTNSNPIHHTSSPHQPFSRNLLNNSKFILDKIR